MAPRGIVLGVIPSLVWHFPCRCWDCGGQRFLLQGEQAWVPPQTHQHQSQCPPHRCQRGSLPPALGEPLLCPRRRPGAGKWWQRLCSSALSLVPGALGVIVVTALLGQSGWDPPPACPRGRSEKGLPFDSRPVLGSRDIRNKTQTQREERIAPLCLMQGARWFRQTLILVNNGRPNI